MRPDVEALPVHYALHCTFITRPHYMVDMGTDTINLLPDGKGHFSANGDFSMAGKWQIRVQIRPPDGTLHESTVTLLTSSLSIHYQRFPRNS